MQRSNRRQNNNLLTIRRPSVALADYDISDRRSSAMSSLLLLFALFEGMCGFVLPICSAFRVSNTSQKRYYYEHFLIFQYCLSIVALAYLQSLIFYYDRKENLRRKQELIFTNQVNETRRLWSDQSISDTENNDGDREEQQWDLQIQRNDDKLRLVTFTDTHETTIIDKSNELNTNQNDLLNMKHLEDQTNFIDEEGGSISSNEDMMNLVKLNQKRSSNTLKLNKSHQSEHKSPILSVSFANPVINTNNISDKTTLNDNNYNEDDCEETKQQETIDNMNKNNHDEIKQPIVYEQTEMNTKSEKMKFFNQNIIGHNNNEDDCTNMNNTSNTGNNNSNEKNVYQSPHTLVVEYKSSNSYAYNTTNIKNNDNNRNHISNKSNYLAKKMKHEKICKSSKQKITKCCHRSTERMGKGSFYPLAILFGDKPRTFRRECYFSRDTEGVNLYLRLGAVGFGFGVMIFDGFKIAEPWEEVNINTVPCHGHLWIPLHILHFIYVFWQTYFLFKHHRVVFNVQKFVLRFLLCHLAVANLCQWLKTILDEIGSERNHDDSSKKLEYDLIFPDENFFNTKSHSDKTVYKYENTGNLSIFNLTDIVNSVLSNAKESVTNTTLLHLDHVNATTHPENEVLGCGSTVKYMAPYLFPCAIEYSLIAGAIFYKMFEKVGHVRKESERLEKLRKANPKIKQFSECHRSHKGLFVGLLLFMATLVAMSLFFIFIVKRDKRNTAITLYQGTELVLLSVSTITCIISLFRLRALKLSDLSEEVAFDDNLLLIGLVGMLFYDLFLLVPALEAIPNGVIAAKLYAAKSILEMIQSMLQVFFILEASRRCAGTLEHVQNKPGRTMITFLLVLNLAMWFVNTFEVKHADNHSIHIDYYSSMAWKIITHIALPLIVFFRFHSTVCLSDIWANAYRFRTE
ncbi:unnamed protein product [Heterobilharzia americana]|nr:unnamed protein product [Heterobilharzia americana]